MSISESPGETIARSGISLADVTAARLSQAMAAGTLTSAELVRFYLERIERHNPALGAVISVSRDAAEQAAAVDQARTAGAKLGPLAGIPVLIKDNISVAGSPARRRNRSSRTRRRPCPLPPSRWTTRPLHNP